jgi:hypothetical protein
LGEIANGKGYTEGMTVSMEVSGLFPAPAVLNPPSGRGIFSDIWCPETESIFNLLLITP